MSQLRELFLGVWGLSHQNYFYNQNWRERVLYWIGSLWPCCNPSATSSTNSTGHHRAAPQRPRSSRIRRTWSSPLRGRCPRLRGSRGIYSAWRWRRALRAARTGCWSCGMNFRNVFSNLRLQWRPSDWQKCHKNGSSTCMNISWQK